MVILIYDLEIKNYVLFSKKLIEKKIRGKKFSSPVPKPYIFKKKKTETDKTNEPNSFSNLMYMKSNTTVCQVYCRDIYCNRLMV